MTAQTHVAFSLLSTVSLARLTGIVPAPAGWLLVILGTLAPDLDSPESSLAKPGSILWRALPPRTVYFLNGIGQTVSGLVHLLLGHRGLTHSLLLPALLALAGAYLSLPLLLWFSFGYFFHLLGDALTPRGIPALSPFSTRRFSLAQIPTGSFKETVVCWIFLAGVIYLGFDLLPEHTRYWLIEYRKVVFG